MRFVHSRNPSYSAPCKFCLCDSSLQLELRTVKLYKMSPKHVLRLCSLGSEDWSPSSWKKKYFKRVWKQNFISERKKNSVKVTSARNYLFSHYSYFFSCYNSHIIIYNGYFFIWIKSNVLFSRYLDICIFWIHKLQNLRCHNRRYSALKVTPLFLYNP